MGFLADEDSAIMWRGLILNRAVQQFLEDVHWGDLDYLLIDMPPGTGDIQMGLARMLPRTEVIVVTTPPVAAQKVAARTADMARKGYLRVAGVIENMSDFTCEHGTSYALFGSGGGARLAADVGVPLIGQIPLHPSVAAGGDAGTPVALDEGQPAGRGVRRHRRVGHHHHRPGGGHGRLQRAPPRAGGGGRRRRDDRRQPVTDHGLTGSGRARRPAQTVPAFGPQTCAGQLGQGRVDRRARRQPVGQGLLVALVPGAEDEHVAVLDQDDGQHVGTSVTWLAQAITSPVDRKPSMLRRLAMVGRQQLDLAGGLAGQRLGRAGPRWWRWSPRRRGWPSGPGGRR